MADDLVARARDLAHRAHVGQVDKAGRPYIEHVARVAAAVADDPTAEAVAWLHDVWEDCPHHVDELWHEFPDGVVDCVGRLTRHAWLNDSEYYRRIRNSRVAVRVKLADIADNADEARLALLDDATAARLRGKYQQAVRTLAGGNDGR